MFNDAHHFESEHFSKIVKTMQNVKIKKFFYTMQYIYNLYKYNIVFFKNVLWPTARPCNFWPTRSVHKNDIVANHEIHPCQKKRSKDH